MSVPRIVDAVFCREPVSRRPRRIALALAAGVGLHAGTVLWAVLSAPSLDTWSAELATKVHAELTREVVVELPKPPPPPEKPPPERVPERRAAQQRPAPSPAQAAKIVDAVPQGAADLPETTFVTGSAAAYAGGVTSSTGKSQVAVNGPIAQGGPPAGPRAADRSAPVSIEESNWSCPWPREADAAEIDEQAVLIQVVVRADGSAESVRTLTEPGHGFGAAARACALASRFVPAHDPDGRPVRAQSPPIRVHFFR